MARHPAGRAVEAAPLLFGGAALACGLAAVAWGSLWPLLPAGFVLYGLPPLLHRIHDRIAPLERGIFPVVGPHYLPWWGSHQLQRLYIAVPLLEDVLHLIPGAFSVWLRMWGAEVGAGVVWSPGVRIVDRSLLKVGDGAIFGYGVQATAHLIAPRRGSLVLLLRPIRVGAGAVIGAEAKLGPGARVGEGALIKALSVVAPIQVVE